jgi:3'-5' exoribonuclease
MKIIDIKTSLSADDRFGGVVIVKDVVVSKTAAGKDFMTITLADNSGTIPARLWEVTSRAKSVIVKAAVLYVSAKVNVYKGEKQLSLLSFVVPEEGTYDMAALIESAPKSVDSMYNGLIELISSIKDSDYRSLVVSAVESAISQSGFLTRPAAKEMHHAWQSGLLQHSLAVAKLADAVSSLYGDKVNRDLLLAGAILHDIGKIQELTDMPEGDYTSIGRLVGHISLGCSFLQFVINGLPNFPSQKSALIMHMVLSHHGTPEMGSAITPKIIEAEILHHIDYLDSSIDGLNTFIQSETQGKPLAMTSYNRRRESYFFATPHEK